MLNRVPMVLCLHDAMTERWPEKFFPTARKRLKLRAKHWLARRRAHRPVTPTLASARDIAEPLLEKAQISGPETGG